MKKIIKNILSLSRSNKIRIVIANDILLSVIISCLIAEVSSIPYLDYLIYHLPFSLIIITLFYFLNMYSNQLKYLSNKALLEIFNVFLLLSLFVFITTEIINLQLPHIYIF